MSGESSIFLFRKSTHRLLGTFIERKLVCMTRRATETMHIAEIGPPPPPADAFLPYLFWDSAGHLIYTCQSRLEHIFHICL